MDSFQALKKQARIAGWLYLIIALGAGFGYGYTQGVLHIPSDAAQSLLNIQEAGGLFRLAILTSIIGFICDIAVATILYRILRSVSKLTALMAAFFRVVQTAILGANMLNLVAISMISAGMLTSFTTEQSQDLTQFLLSMHDAGFDIAMLFFGMHCALLAYLFWKSEYFPKWLAGLVAFAGASYLFDSTIALGIPGFASSTEPVVIAASLVGEFTLIFWLIIKGLKKPH